MGIEGHFSVDEILRQLNAGEIVPGDRPQTVMLPNGTEASYRPEHRELSFTQNNVTAKAIISETEVTELSLIHPITGDSINDSVLQKSRTEVLEQWLRNGELSL